jgi:integrase/recombinase XerD
MRLRAAIDQFVQGYFSTRDRSRKTVAAYTSDLHQFRRFARRTQDLSEMTPELVERWALELRQRGYKPSSVRRKLASLRVLCNYWARREVLVRSPFWRLRLNLGPTQVLPRTLTTDEMSSLLRQAARSAKRYPPDHRSRPGPAFTAYRDLAIVELLFATGMRVGELTKLRVQDLAIADRSLLIQGKGQRERIAYLPEPRSFAVIRSYARHRRHLATENEALFIDPSGRAISTEEVRTALRRIAHDAGLAKHVTPHMLRHTAATLLLRNGADLRVVQEFLGHASIVMTQRYTHVANEHLMKTLKERHPRAMLRA